jgi:hypothetical protein
MGRAESMSKCGMFVLAAAMSFIAGRAAEGGPAKTAAVAKLPFAVIELFSSEGCSYCPGAEKALNALIATERAADRNVLLLATHVPWWKDAYGKPQFAERLKRYKRIGGRYSTPTAVVSGRFLRIVSFGKNFDQIKAVMESQLKKPAAVGVAIDVPIDVDRPARDQGGDQKRALTVNYRVAGRTAGRRLNVVLVESGIVSTVEQGENKGRTLRHENLAREMVSVPLKTAAAGTVTLPVKPAYNLNNCSVMAFVDDPATGVHLGATRGVRLKAPAAADE